MKRIKEIIGVLLLVTGIACTEDKGNYNYTPLNELTINGINKTYVAEIDSVLSISVNIIGEKGFREDDYEYLWYAWRTSDAKTTDTLSLKKDLNVKLSIDVGEYTLRYVVTEKASGVFFESEIDLSVIDKYSKGVMALSRIEGDYSDITFINVKNTVTQHAYKQANGNSVGRHPKGIFYQQKKGLSQWNRKILRILCPFPNGFTSNRKEQSWKPLQQTQVNGMNI